MDSARRKATYEDLRQVPDHLIAEIIAGELHTTPRPAAPHTVASSFIGQDLGPFSRKPGGSGGPGGWWILDEPELHLGADVVVPDLAGWRHERMPAVPDVPHFELAPDWACEVVSPSTGRLDRMQKVPLYARERVWSLWLVDPLARTLEIYRLDGERWTVVETLGGDAVVRAEPFGDIEIDLGRWWSVA